MEFDVYKNNYIDVTRRGDEIRFITEITRDNLHYCKLYYLCFIDTTCVFHRQVNKFFDTFSWNINPGAEIP